MILILSQKEKEYEENKYYMYKYAKNILKIKIIERFTASSTVSWCLIAYLAATELIIEYEKRLIVVMAEW